MHAGKEFMERFWYHVKQLVNAHTSDTDNPHKVSKTQIGLGNVENKNSATIRGEITSANVTAALGYTPLDAAKKGATNGVAELDSTGKVPSAQLPSFVDDVVEGYLSGGKFYKESAHTTQITGESGKIYVDLTTGKTYRWSGSAFVEISQSLALGETSTTAYRGDRGKTAYDHSLKTSGNPHGVTKSDVGLGNVPNVATNDQTPTFTTANDDTALVSGEKLSISLGKIARSILSVISLKKQVDELNSNKQEKIICIDTRFQTTENSVINIKDNLITGTTCPENDSYIPVVIGHASTNSCIEHIFCDGGQWKCYSTDSQVITVRFYKINI